VRPAGTDPGQAGGLEAFARQVTAAGGSGGVSRVHWMEQVHGTDVITLALAPDSTGTEPVDASGSGAPVATAVCAGDGDALVGAGPGSAVAVLTADCGSIALGSAEGVFAAVHAGWRGLAGGVVEAAVAAMRERGATNVVGALGPCIHPECYQFSPHHLDQVAAVYGDGVRGRTSAGQPALDLPAAVSAALVAAGAAEVTGTEACTACGGGYFSHRARADLGRQALVVWSTGRTGTG
jgi:copper oxidase (laccase) domain-containing protein